MRSNTVHLFVIVVISYCLPTFVFSQENEKPSCNECHNGHADRPGSAGPGSPHLLLEQSAHRSLDCTECHESIDEDDIDPTSARPHCEEPEPVNCGECHEDEAEIYTKHGRLEVAKTPIWLRGNMPKDMHDHEHESD